LILEVKIVLGTIIFINVLFGVGGYLEARRVANYKRKKGDCMRKPDN